MLEPELCSSRVLSAFRDDSGDEELSVLPRHTKVIVTGNNRTKSVLVGLQGVVKKAVGLGGWHWLVLKNGVEVKLQRNALSVLEHPTGNEDDDLDYDNYSSSSDINEKDNDFSSSIEFHKFSKPRVRHTRPCLQSISAKSNSRGSYREVHSIHGSQLRLNLSKLRTESLWRYCRHFNLVSSNSNPSRGQMVNAVLHHFTHELEVDEVSVIKELVRGAKRLKKNSEPRD
ncbi:Histone deacetylase complex subunit SAP30/SAP30-like [Quillaja saponaria]|uniref:Histone deacetylase complex subunit SAP30/SAP30-like n=1 Tax=Quillaja saponaria TaxID=32244 RepID=A0AAD7KSD2_QUISA|nr:Histone deacetylase complex subunit SAP30/SAP30-like [Quillaja saponaria]